MDGGPAYELVEVTRRFGRRTANDGVSFTVQRGEVLALLGDNGAGKTTLVRQMAALDVPNDGRIELFGASATAARVARFVGYMPQAARALNHLTVGEAFAFTARLRGASRPEAAAERDRVLAEWDVEELRDRDTAELSPGQQRIARMAVATVSRPPVLLLDEPTNDLDALRRQQVWTALRRLRDDGTTIVLVTHDANEAERVVDRVVVLSGGRVLAVGRPADLREEVFGDAYRLRIPATAAGERAAVAARGLGVSVRDAGGALVGDVLAERVGDVAGHMLGLGIGIELTHPRLEETYLAVLAAAGAVR